MRTNDPLFQKLFIMVICFGLSVYLLAPLSVALAEDAPSASTEGVSGCNAIVVDPAMSLEEQQNICSTAEQFPRSSCSSGGHGSCSSPKKDGTNVDGNHCICLDVTDEVAP